MTCEVGSGYYPLMTTGWQQMAAFVIQFRPETEIAAGRFEGKIEHVASNQAMRFHSLPELLDFIERVLAEVYNTEEA